MTQIAKVTSENIYKNQAHQEKMSVTQNTFSPQMKQVINAQDTISIGKRAKKPEKTGPVNFGEGAKLVAKGFLNKTKEMLLSIVKHPLKTIAAIGVTAGIMTALPLIGISSAVGTSALALGFASFAVIKTAKDISKAVKHNKNEDYQGLRKDLTNIGGDTLDLALSAPFVPKAAKTIKGYAKFGPKVGLNKELIKGLKEAKGPLNKYIEFKTADVKIKYFKIAEEMGFKIKPELVFKNKMSAGTAAAFDSRSGQIYYPKKSLNPLIKIKGAIRRKAIGIKLPENNFAPEAVLRHELEHAKQFSDIARTENLGTNAIIKLLNYQRKKYPNYYSKNAELTKESVKYFEKTIENERSIIKKQLYKSLLNKERTKLRSYNIPVSEVKKACSKEIGINQNFYDKMTKQFGILHANDPKAVEAAKYLANPENKLKTISKLTEITNKIAKKQMTIKEGTLEGMKVCRAIPVETGAYAAQEQYVKDFINYRPNTLTAMLQADSLANKEVS